MFSLLSWAAFKIWSFVFQVQQMCQGGVFILPWLQFVFAVTIFLAPFIITGWISMPGFPFCQFFCDCVWAPPLCWQILKNYLLTCICQYLDAYFFF